MGLVREPNGVDLIVGPSILTEKDKKFISVLIAEYKRTGKIPSKSSSLRLARKKRQTTKA
jgi:hypothetical protein